MGLLGSFGAATASDFGKSDFGSRIFGSRCWRLVSAGFKPTWDRHRPPGSSASPGLSANDPQAPDVPMRAGSPTESPALVDQPVHRIESMTEVAWSPVGAGRGAVSRGRCETGVPSSGSRAVSLSPRAARDWPSGAQFETIVPGEPSAAGIVSMPPANCSIPGCDAPPGRNRTPRPPGPDSTQRLRHTSSDAPAANTVARTGHLLGGSNPVRWFILGRSRIQAVLESPDLALASCIIRSGRGVGMSDAGWEASAGIG